MTPEIQLKLELQAAYKMLDHGFIYRDLKKIEKALTIIDAKLENVMEIPCENEIVKKLYQELYQCTQKFLNCEVTKDYVNDRFFDQIQLKQILDDIKYTEKIKTSNSEIKAIEKALEGVEEEKPICVNDSTPCNIVPPEVVTEPAKYETAKDFEIPQSMHVDSFDLHANDFQTENFGEMTFNQENNLTQFNTDDLFGHKGTIETEPFLASESFAESEPLVNPEPLVETEQFVETTKNIDEDKTFDDLNDDPIVQTEPTMDADAFLNQYEYCRNKMPFCAIASLLNENGTIIHWYNRMYNNFIKMDKREQTEVLQRYSYENDLALCSIILPNDAEVYDDSARLLDQMFPAIGLNTYRLVSCLDQLIEPENKDKLLTKEFVRMEKEINSLVWEGYNNEYFSATEMENMTAKYYDPDHLTLNNAKFAAALIPIVHSYAYRKDDYLLQNRAGYMSRIVHGIKAHGINTMEDLYLRTLYVLSTIER